MLLTRPSSADALAGVVPVPATADPLADMRSALNVVNLTSAGRLYWLMPPTMANRLSTRVGIGGSSFVPRG